jgi:quercetin dioxygenase-like cupin family protein
MTSHLVRRAADARYEPPSGWAAAAQGFRRWTILDEGAGAVHTGFFLGDLDYGGSIPSHVHSFETSFYVVEGTGVIDLPDGAVEVGPGDYGLVPVGVAHAWRNLSGAPVRFAEMQGPQPRSRYGGDTFLVAPLPERDPVPIDVRDPRNRHFGTITPAHMDPGKQSQDLLAVSASMRTALLVYSGITVKMMVDADLGAVLTTMFMVQYQPGGSAGAHDHPFEETYLILDGSVDAQFDGEPYRLGPGDVAWAGAGCVHGFVNAGDVPVRWLETQAPQPPPRHSYRFARDWDYLRAVLDG